MNRREFIMASTASIATPLTQRSLVAQQAGRGLARTGLRTITYNVLACRGYPESRKNRTKLDHARPQMTTRFALELGLYEPDIVSFQEAPDKDTVASIAQQMGMNFVWFPGGWEGDEDWPGGFPGAIITHFPIIDSENCPLVQGPRPSDLFTRHWGRAVVQTDIGELAFFSAHLHPSNHVVRTREITEIRQVIADDLRFNRSLLLQGDLNHKPSGPEYQLWTRADLVDAWAEKGTGQAFTVSRRGPRARIDYIWAHGPIAQCLSECRVLFEGAFRTNPDDPQSFALSDHLPVLATFE